MPNIMYSTIMCALLIVSVAMLMGVANCMDFHAGDLASEDSLWSLYERWLSLYSVQRLDADEKKMRFNVFKDNVNFIHNFNQKGERPYKLRLNKFADMTNQEFRRFYAGSMIDHHRALRGGNRARSGIFMYENVTVAPSVDWRLKGAVNAIKDQGQCGSCWAFSTIASTESINAIRTKKMVSLSEQELVDCDNTQNQGCSGGLMDLAFEFIEKNGITSEQNYPYTAQDGTCDKTKERSRVVTIDGHEDVPANDETALMKAVTNQPVSVAIDASGSSFQFYSEGVFTGDCGTELDHGVNVVGYGTTSDGSKYWIVRNSWGAGWGEKGYVKMARGVSESGLCGIAMQASYPVKNAASPSSEIEMKDEL